MDEQRTIGQGGATADPPPPPDATASPPLPPGLPAAPEATEAPDTPEAPARSPGDHRGVALLLGTVAVVAALVAARASALSSDATDAWQSALRTEVKRATAGLDVDGKRIPAGSYAVALAQPSKRLIRVLLDRQVPLEEKFLKEQERRRARKLPDEIYDVTGWSLPLLYNVEMISSGVPHSWVGT